MLVFRAALPSPVKDVFWHKTGDRFFVKHTTARFNLGALCWIAQIAFSVPSENGFDIGKNFRIDIAPAVERSWLIAALKRKGGDTARAPYRRAK